MIDYLRDILFRALIEHPAVEHAARPVWFEKKNADGSEVRGWKKAAELAKMPEADVRAALELVAAAACEHGDRVPAVCGQLRRALRGVRCPCKACVDHDGFMAQCEDGDVCTKLDCLLCWPDECVQCRDAASRHTADGCTTRLTQEAELQIKELSAQAQPHVDQLEALAQELELTGVSHRGQERDVKMKLAALGKQARTVVDHPDNQVSCSTGTCDLPPGLARRSADGKHIWDPEGGLVRHVAEEAVA